MSTGGLQGRFMRPRRGRRPCGWRGMHSGKGAVGVDIAWPCGHSQGGTTPTCAAHLEHLLSQGGTASAAVPCAVCEIPGVARVTATHDVYPAPRYLRRRSAGSRGGR